MKLVSYDKNGLVFDNGKKLTDFHDQDCCEKVYADFENMQVMGVREKNYVDSRDLDFFDDLLSSVVPIPEVGFYLVTRQGICILVSCYDYQNGYYSSALALEYDGRSRDITGCTEEHWD